MSGRILIVESIATNRIRLRTGLEESHYSVMCCATVTEARAALAGFAPDAILLDIGNSVAGPLGFCAEVSASGPRPSAPRARAWNDGSVVGLSAVMPRAQASFSPVPVIAMVEPGRDAARLAALRAGAVDVFEKPAVLPLLQARIRSILRQRHAMAELRPRADTRLALGFAEDEADFRTPPRIVVLTARPEAVGPALSEVRTGPARQIEMYRPSADFPDAEGAQPPDLFIVDTVRAGLGPGDLFRLLADLRSRSSMRHAAQLVILPAGAPDLAAMSLDLGANDLVTDLVNSAELAHRIEALLRHKAAADRLRASVQSGLEAAVTDPLTGLYNRRYALSQLTRMASESAARATGFATMVLDIDHFKAINDTYGHAAGDRVLISVAKRLRDALRPGDFVARIGGEEFLVAMPDATVEDARRMAERLRRVVGDKLFDITQSEPGRTRVTRIDIPVTLSVGVAMGGADCAGEADISALYARADAALYAAKTAGRNMVTLSANTAA